MINSITAKNIFFVQQNTVNAQQVQLIVSSIVKIVHMGGKEIIGVWEILHMTNTVSMKKKENIIKRVFSWNYGHIRQLFLLFYLLKCGFGFGRYVKIIINKKSKFKKDWRVLY